jgi:hypothetical protein
MELSDREQELFDFIKQGNGVTVKQIQDNLTPQHVGAMGRLIGNKLVKKEKRREGNPGYAVKMITYYVINNEGENNV